MAIFQGEEIVPVTTPDGRTLQLPRSLAMMSGQQGAAPNTGPAPIGVPGAPPMAPPQQEMPQPTLPPPDVAPAGAPIVEEGEPDTVPVTMMEPEVVTANPKRVQKARKAQAAYNASPEGKQAAAQKAQVDAQQSQVDAVNAQVDVDAATNDLVHGAMVERNASITAAENARNQEMLARAQEQESKMNEVVSLRKKIEGTKIDRKADHPVLAAIMAGLAGLGSAMKGQKVDTLDILYTAIDRKVAAQQADLDNMGKVYGMTKDELEMLKDKSKNRLEFHNAMIAAETNKAIRTIEELTARSASEKTRANGKAMIAELQARAADKTMEATRWGLEYDQRAQAEKNQNSRFYSDLSFRKQQHADTVQLHREDTAADLAKALANTKATKSSDEYKLQLEAAKEARQFGVRDMNGDLFLSPEARAQMAQAKSLEDEAAKLEADPDVMKRSIASTRIQALREKAAVMRGEAQTFGSIKAHNETEAVAVSNMIASGQSVVQLIDGIKELSDQAGRGLISRDDAQVKLRAMFNQLKPGLKEAWQLGAWDKGAANLVADIIGADPSSDWNAGVLGMALTQKMYENPKAFQEGLNSVAEDLEARAKNKLVGIGAKFGQGEAVLQRKVAPETSESAAKLSAARSGTELTKNAEDVGVVGKTARAIGYPFSPSHAAEADAAQSTKYIGLNKSQEAPFEERLQAYKKGDKRAGEELVALVAESAQKRPDLALPLLRALRDNAPSTLYQAARATLPKDSEADQQMAYEEKSRIGAAMTPGGTPVLAQQVLNSVDDQGKVTDIEGFRDLARRASEGDQIAKKALLEINKQSGYNKSLPRGSVFNKGAR